MVETSMSGRASRRNHASHGRKYKCKWQQQAKGQDVRKREVEEEAPASQ